MIVFSASGGKGEKKINKNLLMGNITPQKIIIYVKFGRTFLCNNNILFKCGCLFKIIICIMCIRIIPDCAAEEEIPQEKKKRSVVCSWGGKLRERAQCRRLWPITCTGREVVTLHYVYIYMSRWFLRETAVFHNNIIII